MDADLCLSLLPPSQIPGSLPTSTEHLQYLPLISSGSHRSSPPALSFPTHCFIPASNSSRHSLRTHSQRNRWADRRSSPLPLLIHIQFPPASFPALLENTCCSLPSPSPHLQSSPRSSPPTLSPSPHCFVPAPNTCRYSLGAYRPFWEASVLTAGLHLSLHSSTVPQSHPQCYCRSFVLTSPHFL